MTPRRRPGCRRAGVCGPAIASIALFFALAAAAQKPPATDPDAARARQEKQELDALRGRLDKLKRELAATEGDRAEAADQLKDVEHSISESNRSLRELSQAGATARRELREIEAAMKRTEGAIADRGRELERLLYRRYVAGDHDALRLVLSGDDPQRIARELHYFSYVSQAQSETIRDLRANAASQKTLAERARAKTAEIAALEARERTARSQLEAARREQRSLVEKLAGRIQAQRKEILTAERNEQRLSRLVESLTRMLRERAEREAADRAARKAREQATRKADESVRQRARKEKNDPTTPPAVRNDKVPEAGEDRGVFSTLRGRLRLPVRGEISGRFGAARADGGPSWKGVFIRAASGTEVRAVGPGRVVFADWMRGFGNLLIVDHGEGYLTIYGNNESLLKQPGDAVKPGDTIATVGASGGSEFSGLYFEMRHLGRPIDPMGWTAR